MVLSWARFFLGLVLAVTFATSVSVALVLTYTLVKEVINARGNIEEFEIRLRHYTDGFESSDSGELRLIRATHPILTMVGFLIGALTVAFATAFGIRAIFAVRRAVDG